MSVGHHNSYSVKVNYLLVGSVCHIVQIYTVTISAHLIKRNSIGVAPINVAKSVTKENKRIGAFYLTAQSLGYSVAVTV